MSNVQAISDKVAAFIGLYFYKTAVEVEPLKASTRLFSEYLRYTVRTSYLDVSNISWELDVIAANLYLKIREFTGGQLFTTSVLPFLSDDEIYVSSRNRNIHLRTNKWHDLVTNNTYLTFTVGINY